MVLPAASHQMVSLHFLSPGRLIKITFERGFLREAATRKYQNGWLSYSTSEI